MSVGKPIVLLGGPKENPPIKILEPEAAAQVVLNGGDS